VFTVDGEPVDFTQRVTWRGIMINGLPNMAYVFGYFRHSRTLRVDLVSDLVCRLLAKMQEKHAEMVVPALRPQDTDMRLRPWCDLENFNAGLCHALAAHPVQTRRSRAMDPPAGARPGARDPARGRPRRRNARYR
jgi:hypothetical protein